MASVEDWSDGDIRSKLAELGHPVGPVTETTRKTLVKKLKKLLQAGSASPGRTRRSLSRFSSGEDDSQDDAPSSMPPPTRVRNLRRRTVGAADITPVNDSTSSSLLRDSGTTNKTITKVSRKSTSVITTAPRDDFDDSGSDSDVPAIPYSNITSRRSLKTEPASPSRTFTSSRPESIGTPARTFTSPRPEPSIPPSRMFSSLRSESSSTASRAFASPRTEPIAPSRQFTSPRSELDPSSSTSESVTYRQVPITRTSVLPSEGISSRTVETSRIYDTVSDHRRKTVLVDDNEDNDNEGSKSSGFHSDFLLRLQEQNRASGGYKPPSTSRDISTARVYSRSSISPKREVFNSYKNFDFVNDYRRRISAATKDLFTTNKSGDHIHSKLRKEDSLGLAAKFCNNTLIYIGIALITVLILGAVYVNLGSNPLGLESDDNVYPICDAENTTSPCIEAKHLQPALNLLKIITPKLQEMATKAYCDALPGSDALDPPVMSEQEAVDYLLKKVPGATKRFQVEEDLRRMKIVVMANPHWDIQVVDDSGTGKTDVKTLVVTGGLAANHLNLPLSCVVRHFAYGIARWVMYAVILVGVVGLVAYGSRVYQRQKERHRRDVYSMVNRILTMLAQHYEQGGQLGMLAVDNCRDELIQPAHRDSMKNVWDAAVDFIEKHESRVRTELHNVRGENVKVWRWLPANGPPMSPSEPKLDRLM